MSAKSHKKKLWGCSLCHNRQNLSVFVVCSTCGASREQDRFGLKINEKHYLCRVNTHLFRPSVSVFCQENNEYFTTILLNSENELVERVIETIIQQNEKKEVSTIEG